MNPSSTDSQPLRPGFPIPLRPHHLLCTQGYSGHGYSPEYVTHMNQVVSRLRTDPDVLVHITFGNDTLCSVCPHQRREKSPESTGPNDRAISDKPDSEILSCDTEDKVRGFDQRTADLIRLTEGVYRYQDLIHRIDSSMTDEKMDKVCGTCSWAKMSQCKANILSGKYLL